MMTQQDKDNEKMNQPRGKGRFNSDYRLEHVYEFYKKKYGADVSKSVHRSVCVEFNDFVVKQYLFNGIDFNMGFNLGSLGIRKKKLCAYFMENGKLRISHIPVDYKKTKELWKSNPQAKAEKRLVRHLNKHTNGYKCFFFWDRYTSPLLNKNVYKFVATRTNMRELSAMLQSEDNNVDFCINTK